MWDFLLSVEAIFYICEISNIFFKFRGKQLFSIFNIIAQFVELE